MEHHIKSLDELPELAKTLIAFAGKRKKMLFNGEIGAGKTTFIKILCKTLGVDNGVSSPTFSLINEYVVESSNMQKNLIHHIDLYRLNDAEEAIDIGIEDYLHGPHYCFIEWPDIITHLLPEDVVKINIEILEDSSRKILFL